MATVLPVAPMVATTLPVMMVMATVLPVVAALSSPLFLTPLLDSGQMTRAQTLSLVVQPSVYNGTSHAGFITANRLLGNHLFFWFFPSPEKEGAPVLLWLNGGPGVPSLQGLFLENGPVQPDEEEWRISGKVKLVPRAHSWVGPFALLYIDSPVGTGFSFTENSLAGLRFTQKGYTKDLYSVVSQFYKLFPRLQANDLYIGGQSYAGKYVPSLAYRIHQRNARRTHKLPLTGIYLGAPFYNPRRQSRAFYRFLYSLGWISRPGLARGKMKIKKLFKEFKKRAVTSRNVFSTLFNHPMLVGNTGLLDNFVTGVGIDQELLEAVGNDPVVREAIHVGHTPFIYSEDLPMKFSSGVKADMLVSTRQKVGKLLDHYKVLVYNGDYDLIVNSAMVEAALLKTPWSLQAAYRNTTRLPWRLDVFEAAGYFSLTGNLCRVVVHGAGHQAPRDKPRAVRQMMEDFVYRGCVSG